MKIVKTMTSFESRLLTIKAREQRLRPPQYDAQRWIDRKIQIENTMQVVPAGVVQEVTKHLGTVDGQLYWMSYKLASYLLDFGRCVLFSDQKECQALTVLVSVLIYASYLSAEFAKLQRDASVVDGGYTAIVRANEQALNDYVHNLHLSIDTFIDGIVSQLDVSDSGAKDIKTFVQDLKTLKKQAVLMGERLNYFDHYTREQLAHKIDQAVQKALEAKKGIDRSRSYREKLQQVENVANTANRAEQVGAVERGIEKLNEARKERRGALIEQIVAAPLISNTVVEGIISGLTTVFPSLAGWWKTHDDVLDRLYLDSVQRYYPDVKETDPEALASLITYRGVGGVREDRYQQIVYHVIQDALPADATVSLGDMVQQLAIHGSDVGKMTSAEAHRLTESMNFGALPVAPALQQLEGNIKYSYNHFLNQTQSVCRSDLKTCMGPTDLTNVWLATTMLVGALAARFMSQKYKERFKAVALGALALS